MAVTFHSEDCDFMLSNRRKVASWVRDAILAEGYSVGDVAYIFCSGDYHIEMNRTYLGHDYHTDVITFDYSDLHIAKHISGDIFIDPATVQTQAGEWGSEPAEELMRVMIHGVLHLCGYGDKTDAEQQQMRAKEDHYLADYTAKHGMFPSFACE